VCDPRRGLGLRRRLFHLEQKISRCSDLPTLALIGLFLPLRFWGATLRRSWTTNSKHGRMLVKTAKMLAPPRALMLILAFTAFVSLTPREDKDA